MIRVDQINYESRVVELRLADVVSGRVSIRCGAEVIVVDLHVTSIPCHRLKADPVRIQGVSFVSSHEAWPIGQEAIRVRFMCMYQHINRIVLLVTM